MSLLRAGLTPKMKPLSPKRSAMVAALDVGTSKIACVIARLRPHTPQDVLLRRSHTVEVVGFGHTLARGMKGGTVVDLAEVEEAVRQAVDLAERSAKMQLESVVLSISAGRPNSELKSASVNVGATTVSEDDIARVLTAGCQHSVRAGRAVLHSLPIGYTCDESTGIRDPRGMLARRFGIDMHVVTSDGSTARNLMLAIKRCHLEVEAMVASLWRCGSLRPCRRRKRTSVRRSSIWEPAPRRSRSFRADASCIPMGSRWAVGTSRWTSRVVSTPASPTPNGSRRSTAAVLAGGSDERDMISIPPVDEDGREGAAVRVAIAARADHPAAGRRDSRNDARPACRLSICGGAARSRHPHRRGKSAFRYV